MILEAIVAILGGLAGHQSKRFTSELAPGWSNLTEHGIGVMLLFPFFLIFYKGLGKSKRRVELAYLLAAVFVGTGVALGWFSDRLRME